MAGGGREKGPASGRKRKNDNNNVGQNLNIKRSLKTTSDDVDQPSQHSQLKDSWSDEDQSQPDQANVAYVGRGRTKST